MSEITEIKTLNGYPLADTKARADIATLSEEMATIDAAINGKESVTIEAPFPIAGFVFSSTGKFNTSESKASRTDYIATDGFYKAKARLYQGASGCAIAFYSETKTFLAEFSVVGDGLKEYETSIPSAAKYVVFSQYGSSSGQYATLVANPDGIPSRLDAVEKKMDIAVYAGAAFGAFAKWGVISDSLGVGHTQDSGGTNYPRNIYYSWPQYMARNYGNVCLTFGQSGATAKSWMTRANCHDRVIVPDNLCQAYVVALGANDAEKLDDYAGGLGTAADINIEDSSGNADSFYGWYGKVVSTVRSTAPQARIFLFTLPYPRNAWSANVTLVNAAIVEIAGLFENTAVVDLSANYDDYFKADEISGMLVAGHFTATGYANIARVNAMALSDVMNANPADYKDIPFIPFGTATELD
jgi:lysophospholipase L1-like esterase